ncbi:hypothetical protein Pint_31135 [Pistacia integerrima]|uniref:Uncharacterized protein n=1 Tax=Pistacia integerrima TaxID=434235 RepID=A0ACC0XRD6_9ROSI|nr:hypothetical protein Pint_31135 [Pistacia integerrima]
MDMKMILCAVLILAASMTATVANKDVLAPAPAPGPSASAATMPVAGSLVGAFLLSFFGIFFQ